jgi:lysophospholipase L1-like esterase
MSRTKRIAGAIALACAAGILTLGIAEAALRLLVPVPSEYHVLLPGTRVFEPDARFVHGIQGAATYAVNRHGIRGREFGPDGSQYRMLLVGGSTTECGMLDDSENWGAVAERELQTTRDGRNVWVGNVGRSGLTSRDHIVTLRYLLPQYPRMDLVVVLVGVNDLTAALRQGSTYGSPASLSDPDVERRQIRNAFALSPLGFREILTDDETAADDAPWFKKTKLFELAKRARTGMQARQVARGIGGALLGQWREHRRSASRLIDSLPPLKAALADYQNSLEAIVDEAARHNVEVMFMTQPSLWKANMQPGETDKLWLGGTGSFQEEPGHEYYTPRALADAMSRYNAELLALCSARRLPCLDLAVKVPRDTVMFYDDVHFTEGGAARVGKLLSEHLRNVKPDLFRNVTPGAGSVR